MNNKYLNNKRGFTLPEVIVSFTILVLVVVSATNLLVSIIRTNNLNVNTIVAYGLAQEAAEGVRNMRDSFWLLGADFEGKIAGQCALPNGVCLPTVGDSKQYYIYQSRLNDGSPGQPNGSIGVSQLADYAPWELQKTVAPSDDKPSTDSRLYEDNLLSGDVNSQPVYKHCFNGVCSSNPSIYSRYLEIEPVPYTAQGTGGTPQVLKYRVSVVVNWQEQGLKKEVRLTTELTNWKQSAV